MARHYSVREFFRQVPNALLRRYFEARALFAGVDFEAVCETKPEGLVTLLNKVHKKAAGGKSSSDRRPPSIHCCGESRGASRLKSGDVER